MITAAVELLGGNMLLGEVLSSQEGVFVVIWSIRCIFGYPTKILPEVGRIVSLIDEFKKKKKKKEPHLGKVKSIWPEFLSYGNTSGCFLGLTNMIQQNAILAYNQKYRFTTHTHTLSLSLSPSVA